MHWFMRWQPSHNETGRYPWALRIVLQDVTGLDERRGHFVEFKPVRVRFIRPTMAPPDGMRGQIPSQVAIRRDIHPPSRVPFYPNILLKRRRRLNTSDERSRSGDCLLFGAAPRGRPGAV